MRVLILNYEYPPLGGGAANATYHILNQYSKIENLQVDLITSSLNETRIEKHSENIKIHFIDIGGIQNLNYQPLKKLLIYAYRSQQYAKKLLKDVDIVHAFFGIPSGFSAMLMPKPYIVSLRGSDVPFYNKRFALLDHLVFKQLSQIIWKKAAYTIANSEGLRQLALETDKNAQIDLIPNGVDTTFFCPDDSALKSGIFTIISVGRLIPRKGFDLIINAIKGISQVKFQIAGGGIIEQELKEQAEEANVSLELLGQLNRNQLKAALQKADLFVLTSYNEGMSNAALEAMACGLPVILSNVGGSKELINNNGTIVPIGDVETLRNKILFYQKNSNIRETHGKRSREIAMNMNWESVAGKYYNVYEKVIQSLSDEISLQR